MSSSLKNFLKEEPCGSPSTIEIKRHFHSEAEVNERGELERELVHDVFPLLNAIRGKAK